MSIFEVKFIEEEEVITQLEALLSLSKQKHTWITGHHAGKIIACAVRLYDKHCEVYSTNLYGRDYSVPYV